jgi:hypothetical protein
LQLDGCAPVAAARLLARACRLAGGHADSDRWAVT